MIAWVESQPLVMITLVTFGLSYLAVAVIVVVANHYSGRPLAADLKATTPVMLTPLAVISGLLIAFLANRVWNNLDHANTYVAQEANALRVAVSLSDGLPRDTRAALRNSISRYLTFIETDDWPAMAANRASLKESPRGLDEAFQIALTFSPTSANQVSVQQRILVALEHAFDGRRHRILLSQGAISSVQWVVIVVLDVLMLVIIAMVHIDRWRTVAINAVILSTAVAACLVLLLVHDRPFTAGGFTVAPTALRDVIVND